MKNDRFKQLCHFSAAIILLPFAFRLFEQKNFSLSVFFLLAGVTFVFTSGALDWLEKNIGNSIKLVYLLESAVILFAAYLHFKTGKKTPAIVFGGAGVLYFFLFLYFLYGKDVNKKKRKKHRKHRSHHHESSNELHDEE